jgi:putative membrane protein insertion efficiency factor
VSSTGFAASTLGPAFASAASWLLKAPIWAYRLTLSAFIGHGCRYHPTCSAYALEAIDAHGPLRGGLLAARRLARCHPWGKSGIDPVPSPRDQEIRRSEP